MILFVNNGVTTLATALAYGATAMQVSPGSGAIFPLPGGGDYFVMTLLNPSAPAVSEIVHVIARSADTFTVVRAQEGTVQQNWPAGTKAQNLWTAGQAAAMQQA
jgi:hypothetical protein